MSSLKTRLRHADPLAGELPAPLTAPATDITAEVVFEASPRSGRRRMATSAVAGGAAVLAVALVVAGLTLAVTERTHSGGPLTSRPATALPNRPAGNAETARAAEALAQAPRRGNDDFLTGTAVLRERDAQAQDIPLPPGGNYNGVNFEASFTPAQLAQELQANAACQWWRVAAKGDASAVATARQIPKWPAFRGGTDNPLASLANAATAHLEDPEALADATGYCENLHDRLVLQAKQLRQTPPQ